MIHGLGGSICWKELLTKSIGHGGGNCVNSDINRNLLQTEEEAREGKAWGDSGR